VDSLSFKSPKDGSALAFVVVERRDGHIEFEATVLTPWFSGRTPVATEVSGSPSPFFASLASDWKGWDGEKSWRDALASCAPVTSNVMRHEYR
jgi:hypothetical protein